MGNRLAVSVPSQILPIEFYLKEIRDIQVKTSLGNTCFLKVACCNSSEGSVVVKVFVNPDSNVKLEPYHDLLHRVHSHLDNAAPNCLMYASVQITESAGILLRQHIDSSLFERISTRPFLTHLEKSWLAFQLLCALRQSHEAQVYHGDIKTENVLVTGNGWLQLSDFAPYKPVALPDNDPSDFTYFFDTSRRRTCYIAPERFIRCGAEGRDCSPDSSRVGEERDISPSPPAAPRDLTPAMDVFSAGCVLVELFTEGYVPFDLTQLLAYRRDQYTPHKLLDKINDHHMQALVLSMLSRDPSGRRSAGDYLEEGRGTAFPTYFSSFLWPYCRQFSGHRPPDHTIKQISDSLNDILLHLCGERIAQLDMRLTRTTPGSGNRIKRQISNSPHHLAGSAVRLPANHMASYIGGGGDGCSTDGGDDPAMVNTERCEALILVLPIITSAYRSSSLCASKLLGLSTLMRVARFCPDTVILERVLPFVLLGLEAPESSVRASAVFCLTQCLGLVATLPRQDANIFPEYIVPSLDRLTSDSCTIVRQALAENIAIITRTAEGFLDWSLHQGYFNNKEYDVELHTLRDAFQNIVSGLIMDSSNAVKRTFMRNTRGHLWTFFGLARANDIIMTHLITYLNDGQDHHLRSDFFDCLRSNAVMIGPYQGDIILPLVVQGMNDSEEWVVVSSIGALTAMIEVEIFSNCQLFNILEGTLPLLLHPNPVIRHSIVHLMCKLCTHLDPMDALANVRPLLQPYLKPNADIVDFTDELCVLYALDNPIPRQHWRTILNFTDLASLMDRFKSSLASTRYSTVSKCLESNLPTSSPADDKTMRLLLALGVERPLVEKLLLLRQHLLRTHGHRRAAAGSAAKEGGSLDDRGEIQVATAELCGRVAPPEIIRLNLRNVCSNQPVVTGSGRHSGTPGGDSGVSAPASGGITGPPIITEDYGYTRAGRTPSPANRNSLDAGSVGGGSSSNISSNVSHRTATPAAANQGANLVIVSECEEATREVAANRQRLYLSRRSKRHSTHQYREHGGGGPPTSLSAHAWVPDGALIGHLHEHTARIHAMSAVDGTSLFVTASQDGNVRIWDASKSGREFPINRSRGVYGRLGAPVRSLATCSSKDSNFACAAANGNIHVLRLDKLSMVCDRMLDKDEDGYAVDMAFYDSGFGDTVVVYGSVTGGVVGWDLRQPGTAWRFNNGPKNGLITSLMMDPDSNFLGVATNKGKITCWDIRFQLPITRIDHDNKHHIRKLVKNPCDGRSAFAAASGNNEVGLWELDTNYRRQTLWASHREPLVHKEPSAKSVNGLCVGRCGDGPDDAFVVTGGTDCCLRYWNLRDPSASKMLAHASVDHPNYPDVQYRQLRVGENNVIVEESRKDGWAAAGASPPPLSGRGASSPLQGGDMYDPLRPAPGHRDTITAVISLSLPQRLIVSADAMGVVKIWK